MEYYVYSEKVLLQQLTYYIIMHNFTLQLQHIVLSISLIRDSAVEAGDTGKFFWGGGN